MSAESMKVKTDLYKGITDDDLRAKHHHARVRYFCAMVWRGELRRADLPLDVRRELAA